VHRDIKPSNILIGLDGQAKIVDMGLARTTELDRSTGDLTASGVTLGTFDYISPEQAHDPRDADVRSDIYSLGCTLYFLLTGQPPFPDGTALQKLLLHGTRMPEDPRCFRNDVSDTLIAILRKMMAKKPKDRYQEPVDLVNDLRTLATMDSFEWKQEIPDTTVRPHPAGRSWWEFFLPAFICFGGIGLVTLWLYNDDQRSGVYVIPRVEVMEASDVAADDSNPLEPPDEITPPSLSIIPDTSREAAPLRSPSSRMIVVRTSGSPPLDVPASTDTARTLEEAIARWESDPNIERIVIAASSLRLPKTLSIGGSSSNRPLIIEGTQTRRPLLLVGDALGRVPSEAPSSWLLLDAGSVELRGVDIDATYDSFDGAPPALFQVSSGSRLSIFDTTITLKSASKGRLPALFCFKSPANTPPGASALQIERSAIRGQVDVVRIESNDRIELDWKEAWCAAAGSFIDLEGTKTIHRSPRIRAELNHVTSITLNPWIRVRMAATNPFPVPFVRTANDSIFSGSQTLVEWDASNVVEWPFSEQANRVEDLGRWIDLRGMDNVYDVPTIMRLLQVIMSMSSEEVSIDSDSNLLRNERGMELLAAWRTPPTWEPARLHTMTPDATPWSHSGLNPGCRSDQLPPFPVRDDP
jgi:serine/threonine protein kinase